MLFSDFSKANRLRCESERGFNHALSDWSLSDWITATVGELGEAANVAKKLNRVRDDIKGNSETPEQLRADLADELADAFIYLDLTAQSQGISLEEAIVGKFRKTSAKIGYPIGPIGNTALSAIAEERKRQVGEEGWTETHDDAHISGELASAAEGYIASAISRVDGYRVSEPPEAWPFDPSWWKPKGYYHDLKRAAALIAAEMERVERLSKKQACECLACGEPLYDGDPYYPDYNNGGQLHAYCCGPELEGFTDSDGNPLPPGSAIPEPSRYEV